MSLPVIAIIISGVSAAFAASSWTVTFATFRRGRPRVRFKRVVYAPVPVDDEWWSSVRDPQTVQNAFYAQLTNVTAVPVAVESVEIVGRRILKRGRFRRWRARLLVEVAMDPSWVEGEDRMTLEPFTTVSWAIRHDDSVLVPEHWDVTQVRVTLANGSSVASKWLSVTDLPRSDQKLREQWEEYLEKDLLKQTERQLSFDDLSEEAEG
ncbi:hypothetical protein [Streptomyces sp. SAS_270]|uniref:hypothetical protein n=1 Tax=Streptomyces sp. SAS_270 TaxID=3412748 RepID=UPI00403D23F1